MQPEKMERPSVGVATVVTKDGKILLGKDLRKGEELYAVPGGHWESGETLKECAAREVLEESGVTCTNVQMIAVYDFFRADKNKSYVSIGMRAEYVSGDLSDQHEEGRTEWAWYTPDEALALHLFAPDKVFIERFKSGVVLE